MTQSGAVTTATITVFLADDNLIVRAGVRALLQRHADLEIVGEAADYAELVAGAEAAAPHVLVTDIRMPPTFQREGIEAAQQLRKRHPGTGVVVLSQFDDPEYAVALLSEGSAGYGYLLKDRLAEGDQLVDAIRAVATGGTALDPVIIDALVRPVTGDGDLTPGEEELLTQVAGGRPIKAIAVARRTTPEAVSGDVEELFLKIARGASAGTSSSLRRLRLLHQSIVEREEQGETLSRLLPGGLAEKLRTDGRQIGETEKVEVTVLMSDVRGYSGIAEHSDPTVLAAQLNEHRREMNAAVLGEEGTVMQYVGDAVMAVFGAPVAQDDHADRALRAAAAMHAHQAELNERWTHADLPPFGLGIGLSTGEVAAALLGSDERLEYTVVGDTVNTAARLADAATIGAVYAGARTASTTRHLAAWRQLRPLRLKGKREPVQAYELLGLRDAPGTRSGLGDEAPFVGREAEIGRFASRLAEVVDGRQPSV
ncbi:MAG: adenylate/guanylate cyclase domain-containing protein, partial [Acidimicrobiia bacterium]